MVASETPEKKLWERGGGISLNGHGVDDPTSIRVQKLR